MPATKLTPAQINKRYDWFFVQFAHNGATSEPLKVHGPFGPVRQSAIESLRIRLDRSYGRGEHSVTVYGAEYADQTTAEESRVGFGPRLELVRREALFTL
jgi:hypothetical protein